MAELNKVGVESSEKREDLVEKVKGHEVGGEEGMIKVVELVGEEVVEAMEGGGGARRGTHFRTEDVCMVGKVKRFICDGEESYQKF